MFQSFDNVTWVYLSKGENVLKLNESAWGVGMNPQNFLVSICFMSGGFQMIHLCFYCL